MGRKALVVGIGEYKVNSMVSSTNNAIAVAEVLARNGNGDPNFDVDKHTNVSSKGELMGLIHRFFEVKDEVALFYFSGHGVLDMNSGFLVTPDCSKYDAGVSMKDLLDIVNASGCLIKIVILDCCNSGALGNISGSSQLSTIGENVTILTSSHSDGVSRATNGLGLFTTLLIDALNGGAADIMGNITAAGVYSHMDKALSLHEQRPMFKTNVTRFTPLRTVKPQVDKTVLRKIVEYFSYPEEELQLDPSFEPENILDMMPNVKEPYACPKNTEILRNLQKYARLGLLVPIGAEHMYHAAMESKSCKLTPIGQYYWQLADKGKI